MIKRREFITLLGGTAVTWPITARAQQAAKPVIGYFSARSAQSDASLVAAFLQGLKETGFVEGQNVAVEYRWAEGRYDRLPALAEDLVPRQVTVIAATGGTAEAARTATATIPIVFTLAGDPVEIGLVASLNRPGGNVTGVTFLGRELRPKQLELLHELVPAATLIAALVNPSDGTVNSADRETKTLLAAARALGVQIQILNASTEREIDTAFATLVEQRAGALVVVGDPFFDSRRDHIAALAVHYAVPTIHQFREFAAAGGLISYNGSIADAYRQAGTYTGRILKGEKPSNLPVQQSTKFELIINLKAAKALGLTVSQGLLAAADEVIE